MSGHQRYRLRTGPSHRQDPPQGAASVLSSLWRRGRRGHSTCISAIGRRARSSSGPREPAWIATLPTARSSAWPDGPGSPSGSAHTASGIRSSLPHQFRRRRAPSRRPGGRQPRRSPNDDALRPRPGLARPPRHLHCGDLPGRRLRGELDGGGGRYRALVTHVPAGYRATGATPLSADRAGRLPGLLWRPRAWDGGGSGSPSVTRGPGNDAPELRSGPWAIRAAGSPVGAPAQASPAESARCCIHGEGSDP